jgi:hypothetical protein
MANLADHMIYFRAAKDGIYVSRLPHKKMDLM